MYRPTEASPAPYQQACPAAAPLAIIPPDDFTSLRAPAKSAPYEGDLDGSPAVPGTIRIRFNRLRRF